MAVRGGGPLWLPICSCSDLGGFAVLWAQVPGVQAGALEVVKTPPEDLDICPCSDTFYNSAGDLGPHWARKVWV